MLSVSRFSRKEADKTWLAAGKSVIGLRYWTCEGEDTVDTVTETEQELFKWQHFIGTRAVVSTDSRNG